MNRKEGTRERTRTYENHDRQLSISFRSLRSLDHEIEAIFRSVGGSDGYEGRNGDESSEDVVDNPTKRGREVEGLADDILLRTVPAVLLRSASMSVYESQEW